MDSTQLLPVQFHGHTLFVIPHDDEPFTPMKPIVEGMGLAWVPQLRKLKTNQKRWGITMLVIPDANGREQETVCMPVRKLPAYFSTISPNKVKKGDVETIILFQNECDDALWSYWSKGIAVNRRAKPHPPMITERSPLIPQKDLDDLDRSCRQLMYNLGSARRSMGELLDRIYETMDGEMLQVARRYEDLYSLASQVFLDARMVNIRIRKMAASCEARNRR